MLPLQTENNVCMKYMLYSLGHWLGSSGELWSWKKGSLREARQLLQLNPWKQLQGNCTRKMKPNSLVVSTGWWDRYIHSKKLKRVKVLVAQLCLTFCNPKHISLPGSFVHKISPDKNTGVGCHSLLQGIFPTQGSNLDLLHCKQTLYPLSHQEAPEKVK